MITVYYEKLSMGDGNTFLKYKEREIAVQDEQGKGIRGTSQRKTLHKYRGVKETMWLRGEKETRQQG